MINAKQNTLATANPIESKKGLLFILHRLALKSRKPKYFCGN